MPLNKDIYEFLELDESTKEVVVAYINNEGLYNLSEQIEQAQEAYQGWYRTEEEFAQEVFESTAEIPNSLQNYIDWTAVARDLFMTDYFYVDGYVFRNE